MPESFKFRPIGIFHSQFHEKFGTPRQPGLVPAAQGHIEFSSWIQPEIALQGLEEFTHVWVHFIFHLNNNEVYHATVKPPRAGGQSWGCLATRSPHRPNPLGLSLLKIEKVEESRLYVSGQDVVEGTPVVDVKPYLPEVESIPEASSGWLARLGDLVMKVRWSCEVDDATKELVNQVLCSDVRPEAHKKDGAKDHFAIRLENCEVFFRAREFEFEVYQVKTWI